MFGCERCGARYHSKRAAAIRDCPRCLLRDDVASPLVWMPERSRPAEVAPAEETPAAEEDTTASGESVAPAGA
jgi:predicted  nucleic acid-binding Zn-ribbon protein